MAAKPESSFIASVHKHLAEQVYAEKMYNPLRGGTPDVYYEAGRHLWVEYKFIVLPKRPLTPIRIELSELQKLWLRRCHDATGRARVIVGCKAGGVMFNTTSQWEKELTAADFTERILRRDELARYIERLVL
jgi:hypothetical protein